MTEGSNSGSGTHSDTTLYDRYHKDIYLPTDVSVAAHQFLPPTMEPLRVSEHYKKLAEERHLPSEVYMPKYFTVIDVTMIRETMAVYRVLIRFHWNKGVDLAVVLEGDYEMVSAWWCRPHDKHETLDGDQYVQKT